MAYELICQFCNLQFPSPRKNRKYCSKICCNNAYKIRFSGEGNPAFGKTYRSKETHPEWAEKVSKTAKDRKINVGNKNGMKNPEARAKASKTRRERVTSDPEYRKRVSVRMRQAWADGKYDGVKLGKCKWYNHIRPDGSIAKLQGTWEVVYAKHLDEQGIDYIAHQGRIPYLDAAGVERSYYPDFYIPSQDVYVDVKGALFYENHQAKFECIRNSNSDKKFSFFTKEDFSKLGINIGVESVKVKNDVEVFQDT
jgi:hypothetical protein